MSGPVVRRRALVPLATVAAIAAVIGLDTPSGTAGTPNRLRGCATEDSTAVPCVWNAQTRGNGRGRSFVVTNSGVRVYVSARTADALTRGGAQD